jgi:hypothetical protein
VDGRTALADNRLSTNHALGRAKKFALSDVIRAVLVRDMPLGSDCVSTWDSRCAARRPTLVRSARRFVEQRSSRSKKRTFQTAKHGSGLALALSTHDQFNIRSLP